MQKKRIFSLLLALVLLLSAAPMGLAAENKVNGSMETAISVAEGEELTVTTQGYTAYWYKLTTTKPGQFIQLTSNYSGIDFYDAEGYSLPYGYDGNVSTGYTYRALTDEAGAYYFRFYHYNDTPRTYTVSYTLVDNDACEPNNSPEDAYPLTSGEAVDFIVDYNNDDDYFTIETDRPGQDVQLDLSGFDYTSTGNFYLVVDGNSFTVSGNATCYFHAKEAGKHLIYVYSHSNTGKYEQYTLKATVLPGDANEPNDTLEQATRLPIGTDRHFAMGGYGDEDWFVFESAFDEAGGPKLYTLNLLDLASDYSDKFYYDLYAPDGTQLMSKMEVKIRHNNVIACQQEGLYALRLYRDSVGAPRSDLRIRVDEGGADPYEPNDTWLAAAEVQDGQPIQFILSNTEDRDWFKFEVPEAGMTVRVNSDSRVYAFLYSAERLQEFGATDNSGNFINYLDYEYSFTNWYYRFATPGTYYLAVESELSYISEDLRTVTLTLEEAGSEEPNNSWQTAKTIYEGVPVGYDLTAWNDYDWFKFEIPEGVKALRIVGQRTDGGSYRYLYRGRDFETAGDNAAYIASDWGNRAITLSSPAAGTYYVKCSSSRDLDNTLIYHLTMEELPGQSIAEASPIREGEWMEGYYGGYYALGSLKEGDQLRFYGDNITNIYLYDANGKYTQNNISYYQNTAFNISSDGEYYLKFEPHTEANSDGSYKPYRFLVDIADRKLNKGEWYSIEAPESITLLVGETADVDLRLAPHDAKLVQREGGAYSDAMFYSSSSADSNIANTSYTVGRGNYITGKAAGTTTVRYTLSPYSNTYYENYTYRDVTVHVVEPSAESVSIFNTPAHLPLGTAMVLQAAIAPADAADRITWTSSDPSVLYVSESGKVTAVGDGSATITATASSGVSTSVTITVSEAPAKPIVTGLKLDDYDMTLYMGEGGGQLTATVSPADSPVTVSWVSSNLQAATVDQTGKIAPVAPGVAVITASAGDYRASCIVTVQGERINVESIAFDKTELEIPLGGETVLRPIFNPTDATVQSVTWASTDPNVATVSRTGIVNAVGVGETKIIATTLDGGKQATMTIRVTAAPQMGDINGDGYVDSGDAMIALQVTVGKRTLTEAETEAADVNHDGWVDAADAVRILRFFAGYIDSLEG